MKARMEELANFYEEISDQEQAHMFEKLRLKLKKTLQLKMSQPNFVEEV